MTTPKNPITIADHLYIPTLSFKITIDKRAIKKGDAKVSVIAIAYCILITEIKKKTFTPVKQRPLIRQTVINFLFKSLNILELSCENKIKIIRGIIANTFLNTNS